MPVTVEKRVAVTIWKLAMNIEYRTLAGLFGQRNSTVGKIDAELCCAIAKHLLSVHVFIPSTEKLKEVVDGLKSFGVFHRLQGPLIAHTYPSFVQMKVPLIIINVRGVTSFLCKVWW